MTKYGRGCTAGTGGRLGFGTPSKVWSRVLICRSTVSQIVEGEHPPHLSPLQITSVDFRDCGEISYEKARIPPKLGGEVQAYNFGNFDYEIRVEGEGQDTSRIF